MIRPKAKMHQERCKSRVLPKILSSPSRGQNLVNSLKTIAIYSLKVGGFIPSELLF